MTHMMHTFVYCGICLVWQLDPTFHYHEEVEEPLCDNEKLDLAARLAFVLCASSAEANYCALQKALLECAFNH